jgi:hypothetical protein
MKILNLEQKTGIGFLLSLFLLFNFSFISAAVDTSLVDDVFKINSNIQYTKPCINNGSYCSVAAICNYTFYDRDNSIQRNNVLATNVGNGIASTWQYNISQEEVGIYKVDMVCNDLTLSGSETLYYEVTGDGLNRSIGFYVLILVLSLGIIILGLSMEDAPITILGSFGLYFVGLYILFYGIAGIKDTTYTWGIGIVVLALAMYISTRSAYELIVD